MYKKIPLFIGPITSKTDEEILERAKILGESSLDIIEWRADFYKFFYDPQKILKLLFELNEIIGRKTLLFTLRSCEEGGKNPLPFPYFSFLIKYILKNDLDLIFDVEFSLPKNSRINLLNEIHKKKLLAIGSYHNFLGTPSKDFLLKILREMEREAFDILKIAVMAKNEDDSREILDLIKVYKKETKKKLIILAMGENGKATRLLGPILGVDMTFVSLGEKSAPGQLSLDESLKFFKENLWIF